ncbi:bifunctional protein HldE [Bacteroides sp. CAG:1076]|nr:bifunctional protein HldE [Bacteroides sp. CAG:1076]
MVELGKLKKKSILVIGDVMLDKYYVGAVNRISPEAPVPVFRKKTERSVLGGAANVAANLVAANQKVTMMSIIGHDEAGKQLVEYFKQKDINISLTWETERHTTIKTRFLADNNQQVLRLDVEDTDPINEEICQKMLNQLEKEIDCYHLILLSDYLKGLLTYNFTQGVIHMAKEHGIPVIIDVKDSHIEKYKGAYLLKPNLKEIRELTGMPAQTDQEIIEAAETLRVRCECKYVLCTCGARGMVLVGEKHVPFFVDSQVREVYDVSGAGDTTISYLAAAMANGIDMNDAVEIANVAAGIQVGKMGTSSVYIHEIRDFLANEDDGTFHKILHEADLETFRQDNADKKIVFTNGCFDILHIGHKRYLQEASKLGDILVVGVNSDDSVKRLKGPTRPINPEQDRTEMLCAMGFIDYVAVFSEDTPYELIKRIQPDVLVKGGDYKPEEVVGRDIVEARGGRLELIKFVDGKSTTNIINKISHK